MAPCRVAARPSDAPLRSRPLVLEGLAPGRRSPGGLLVRPRRPLASGPLPVAQKRVSREAC